MNVGELIRQYMDHVLPEHVDDTADIFQLGIVDSLFAIQLVMFVEKEFSIKVEREDLSIQNFSSVGALTKFVHSKR